MALPQQKRFSLDEAVKYIEYETGEPCTSNGLLQQAKNAQIGICFYVADVNLRFIELNESDNKWQSVVCPPLLGEQSLKRVVIPIDKPNQISHTIHTIDPRKEEVFPILEGNILQQFADNPEQEIAHIIPWSVSASGSYGLIEIAIIQQKIASNSIHAEYTKWQIERKLPTFNIINQKTKLGTKIAEGNFKYFEASSLMEIKRSDICIPYQALDYYINEKNKPDRIQQAITEIEERAGKTLGKNQLYEKAKMQELFISFSKPYFSYVQMDNKEHEHEILYCDALEKHLIIPKSRKGLSDIQQVFKTEDKSIFPILEGHSLTQLENNKKEINVRSYNIQAVDKAGEKLIISSCSRGDAPRVGPYYEMFSTWLEDKNIPIYNLEPDEPNYMDGKDNGGSWHYWVAPYPLIELQENDLFIPNFELDRFINILNGENELSNKLLNDFYPLDIAFSILRKQNPLDFQSIQAFYKLASKRRIQLSIKTMRDIPFVTRAGISTIAETKVEGEKILSTPTTLVPADEILEVNQYSRVPQKNRGTLFPSGAIYQGEKLFLKLGWVDTIDYWDEDQFADIAVIGFKNEELNKLLIKQELSESTKSQQILEPVELSQNNDKNEWNLTENEYMKLKAYELIPLVMKSLKIDPMAYPPQHNKSGLKKELHTQGINLFKNRFRMTLKTFSKGNNSAWSMAKSNNLIRES